MADEDEDLTDDLEEGSKKGKGPLMIVGAIFGLIAAGAAAASFAVPAKDSVRRFSGPYHHSLFEEKFNTNLRDNDQRRYLQTLLDCMYIAYDETYLAKRATDPLYDPILRDVVGRIISTKTLVETYQGAAREAFLLELRDALNPVLFPVHIGETTRPMARDSVSGLRPGISFGETNFRGGFHSHVLKVNSIEKTLQIDEGEVLTFDGDEEDLKLLTTSGDTLYVDVTEIELEFEGEVKVGVHGRIRQLFARELIAQ
ncbi:MAG: flagellar basal body-associated protein FliL [Chlamydiales bacterium]|jgi:flagellar basal body-associated protein FliL